MQVKHYRVYNKCKFDIGATLANQQQIVIKAGAFQLMTADDIVYIESICSQTKYFAKRWLVPMDQDGKEVSAEELGTYIQTDEHPHLSDEEAKALLSKSAKEVKAYLEEEDDPNELHSIATVAKDMNLTADKLKVLKKKVPNMDLFVEDEEEKEEEEKSVKKPAARTRTKK